MDSLPNRYYERGQVPVGQESALEEPVRPTLKAERSLSVR